tara:strand:- start:121 stop:471 length:351 start_codon:yes stop_codon:yes gene_type:complete
MDSYFGNSTLTNCGPLAEAFTPADVNRFGLLPGLDVALSVRDTMRRLLLPNFLTDTIEGTHQAEHVSVIEPATEVTCGGWVGNAMGADRVEISFILSPVFEVIQAVATGEKIQRNV